MAKTIKITQTRSAIGRLPKHKATLLGLGLRSFSMTPSAIPRVKQAIRNVEIDACARFARRVMEQSDPVRIEDLVANFSGENAD